MPEDYLQNRQTLYKALLGKFDDVNDFPSFSDKLDDENTRRKVWEKIKDDYDDIGDWDYFNNKIAKPADNTPAPRQEEKEEKKTSAVKEVNAPVEAPSEQPQEQDMANYTFTESELQEQGQRQEQEQKVEAPQQQGQPQQQEPQYSIGDDVMVSDDVGRTSQATITAVEEQGVWVQSADGESFFVPTVEGGQPAYYAPQQKEKKQEKPQPVKPTELKKGETVTATSEDGDTMEMSVEGVTKDGAIIVAPDGTRYLARDDGTITPINNDQQEEGASNISVEKAQEAPEEAPQQGEERSFWNKLKGLFREQNVPVQNGGLRRLSKEEQMLRNSMELFTDEIVGGYSENRNIYSDKDFHFDTIKGDDGKEYTVPAGKIIQDFDDKVTLDLYDPAFLAKVEQEVENLRAQGLTGLDTAHYLEYLREAANEKFYNEFLADQIKRQKPKGVADYLLQDRLLGGGLLGSAFKAYGRSPIQNQIAEMARADYEDDAGQWITALGGGFKLLSDWWMFFIGGSMTGKLGEVVTENTFKKLISSYADRLAAKGVPYLRALELAEVRTANSFWVRAGDKLMENIISNATLFGSYDATNTALEELATQGSVDGADVWEAAKGGALMGALLGPASSVAGALTATEQGLRLVGAEMLGFGAETAAFTISSEVEAYRNTGEFIPLSQATLDSAITLLAIKGTSPTTWRGTANNLRSVFDPNMKKNVGLHFDKEEQKILRDAFNSTDVFKDVEELELLEAAQRGGNGEGEKGIDNTERINELRSNFAQGIAKVANDPDIDYETRYKLLHNLFGKDAVLPLPTIAAYEETTDPKTDVTTVTIRDLSGLKVRSVRFKKSQEKERKELTDKLDEDIGKLNTFFQKQEKNIADNLKKEHDGAMALFVIPQRMESTRLKAEQDTDKARKELSEEQIQQLDDDPVGALMQLSMECSKYPEGSEQHERAESAYRTAYNYAQSRAAMNGVTDFLQEVVSNHIEQNDRALDAIAHVDNKGEQTGGIIMVVLDDGTYGYVRTGDIMIKSDGSIDRDGSDDFLIIQNQETGETSAISLNRVRAARNFSLADTKAQQAAEIRNNLTQQLNDGMNGVVAFRPNEVVIVADKDNNPAQLTIVRDAVDDDGQPIEGQVVVKINDGDEQTMSRDDVQRMVKDANRLRINDDEFAKKENELLRDYFKREQEQVKNATIVPSPSEEPLEEKAEEEPKDEEEQEEQPETPVSDYKIGADYFITTDDGKKVRVKVQDTNEDDGTVTIFTYTKANIEGREEEGDRTYTLKAEDLAKMKPEAVEPEEPKEETKEETAPSPLSQIPKDDKGKPLYDQAPAPDVAYDALVEENEGNAAVADFVAEHTLENKKDTLKKAKAALTKAQKATTKEELDKAVKGMDPSDMGKYLAKTQEDVRKAQEAVDAAQQEVDFWQKVVDTPKQRAKEVQKPAEETAKTPEEPAPETPETPETEKPKGGTGPETIAGGNGEVAPQEETPTLSQGEPEQTAMGVEKVVEDNIASDNELLQGLVGKTFEDQYGRKHIITSISGKHYKFKQNSKNAKYEDAADSIPMLDGLLVGKNKVVGSKAEQDEVAALMETRRKRALDLAQRLANDKTLLVENGWRNFRVKDVDPSNNTVVYELENEDRPRRYSIMDLYNDLLSHHIRPVRYTLSEDGEYVEYDKDGKMRTHGWYKDGKKTGIWEEYDKQGNLEIRYNQYRDGKIDGVVEEIGADGRPNFATTYKNGEILEEREWGVDDDGREYVFITTWDDDAEPHVRTEYLNEEKENEPQEPASEPPATEKPKQETSKESEAQQGIIAGDDLPAMRERVKAKADGTTLTDKEIESLDINKFVAKDRLRPILEGVYYKDGFMIASDGYKLIKVKANYPKEYEGKVINPKTGEEIEGKYPNTSGILDRPMNDKCTLLPVDIEKLRKDYKLAKELEDGLKNDPDYEGGGTFVELDAVMPIGHKFESLGFKSMGYRAANVDRMLNIADEAKNVEFYTSGDQIYFVGDGVEGVVMGATPPAGADWVNRGLVYVKDGKVNMENHSVESIQEYISALEKWRDGDNLKANTQSKELKKNKEWFDKLAKQARDRLRKALEKGLLPSGVVTEKDIEGDPRKALKKIANSDKASAAQKDLANTWLLNEKISGMDLPEGSIKKIESEERKRTREREKAQKAIDAWKRVLDLSDDDVRKSIGEAKGEPSERRRRAGERAVEALKKRGVDVVVDADEMQRVLDETQGKKGERPQYLKTPEGEIYGFTYKGKVYLDPNVLDANTPVHEYTHIFDEALQKDNPTLWKQGIELLKQTPLWDEVKNMEGYKDIADDENEIASEVHSRLAGAEGQRYFEQLQAEIESTNGILEKAEKVDFLYRLRNWLDRAMQWVKDKVFGKSDMSLEEFVNMPLNDLLNGGEEQSGEETVGRERSVLDEEETTSKRDTAERVLSNVQGQKQPNTTYNISERDGAFLEDDDNIRFRIGRNRKEEMEQRLTKARPDLKEEERNALFDYLDTLDNRKLENATFDWFAKGTIRIPEDMDKVRQAVDVAGKAKVDPAKYGSPMELLNENADFKPTKPRINPDNVPTLTNKKDYGNGITVYNVKEGTKSRENMREIINTHWGDNANPWCLLQGDGEGNLTEKSLSYWKQYHRYGKKVAFKDGRLLAFFASDDDPQWWDRNDRSHSGIPVTGKMPNDALGRTATYEYKIPVEDITGLNDRYAHRDWKEKYGEVGWDIVPRNIHKGNKQNGLYEEWDDNGQKRTEANYRDGKLDGACKGWDSNGVLVIDGHWRKGERVGKYLIYYDDGTLFSDRDFGNEGEPLSSKEYYDNGQLKEEIEYNKDGVRVRSKTYSKDGDLRLIEWTDEDGGHHSEHYAENGQKIREITSNKFGYTTNTTEWYDNGQLKLKEPRDDDAALNGTREEWYENGKAKNIVPYKHGRADGIEKTFYENGRLSMYTEYKNGNFNGAHVRWSKDGSLYSYQDFKNDKINGLYAQLGGSWRQEHGYWEYKNNREVGKYSQEEGEKILAERMKDVEKRIEEAHKRMTSQESDKTSETAKGNRENNSSEPRFRIERGTDSRTGVQRAQETVDDIMALIDKGRANIEERKQAMEDVSTLFQAAQKQRKYDKAAVRAMTNTLDKMLKNNLFDNSMKGDVERAIADVKNIVANSTIDEDTQLLRAVNKLANVVFENQIRTDRKDIEETLKKTKTARVDASGIKVQGTVDEETANALLIFRGCIFGDISQKNAENLGVSKDMTTQDMRDEMNLASIAMATDPEAWARYAGLETAIDYRDRVSSMGPEVSRLRNEREEQRKQFAQQKKDGQITEAQRREMWNKYDLNVENTIINKKVAASIAIREIRDKINELIASGRDKAKIFYEKQQQTAQEITNDVLADLNGIDNTGQKVENRVQKIANSAPARIFSAPLLTFDQIFKIFGRNSVDGQGFLYKRFMGGWYDAASNEQVGRKEAMDRLNGRVKELFGSEANRFTDLYAKTRQQMGTLTFFDNGDYTEHPVTAGNLLYIYMANKMSDGAMKLACMGITDADVERIKNTLDPRLIDLADWIQEEFLPELREKYNETYKNTFGISMDRIEDYVPLRIFRDAIPDKEGTMATAPTNVGNLSTTTSALKQRTTNNLPIDILGTDALSLIYDHVEDMEHWNAFVQLDKELNMLRNDKEFRARVKNMATLYGAGNALLNNVENVFRLAVGDYVPDTGSTVDRTVAKFGQAVAASKIAFRFNTALKQLASIVNYAPDVNPVAFIRAIGGAPLGRSWRWCMENIPLFEKRWLSRTEGDTRLEITDDDFDFWKRGWIDRMRRWGITPNAAVDAFTVAIGTKAIYDTKYAQYVRDGYSHEDADSKAKQDATLLYNQTQQSSERAFVSTLQVDRTLAAMAVTIFRNAPMSYFRQVAQSARNLKRMLTPNAYGRMVENMAQQYIKDGLTEDQAYTASRRRYLRSLLSESIRLGTFSFLAPYVWRLAGHWISSTARFLFGGDEEDEKKQWEDDFDQSLWLGWLEGIPAGNVITDEAFSLLSGNGTTGHGDSPLLPIGADMQYIYENIGRGRTWETVNELTNLAVSMGIGASPEALENWIFGVVDYCGSAKTARDGLLLFSSIMNAPRSQMNKILLDAMNINAEDAVKMSPEEFVKRYSDSLRRRNAGVFSTFMSDKDKERYETNARKLLKQQVVPKIGGEERNEEYNAAMEKFNAMDAEIKAGEKQIESDYPQPKHPTKAQKAPRQNAMDIFHAEINEKYGAGSYEAYLKLKEQNKILNTATGEGYGNEKIWTSALTNRYLHAATPEEAEAIKDAIVAAKDSIIDYSKNIHIKQ